MKEVRGGWHYLRCSAIQSLIIRRSGNRSRLALKYNWWIREPLDRLRWCSVIDNNRKWGPARSLKEAEGVNEIPLWGKRRVQQSLPLQVLLLPPRRPSFLFCLFTAAQIDLEARRTKKDTTGRGPRREGVSTEENEVGTRRKKNQLKWTAVYE